MRKLDVNFKKPSQEKLDNLLKCYKTGRYIDTEKLSKSITKEFPDYQLAWKVLAVVLKKRGKINESLVACQKSVKLAPQDSEAHNNLGNTFQELGRLEEAMNRYTKAIALKSDYTEAHFNLGNILLEQGRLEEAEACNRKAIALKPDFVEAHYNLGITQKKLGRLEEAMNSYTKAIALKSDYTEAHYNLGIILQEQGRLEEAEACNRKAIASKPKYTDAYNNLGNILQELGKLEEAMNCYIKAIKLKPDYAEAHDNLGTTLNKLGRLEEAEAYNRKAIKFKPDLAEAHYNLSIKLKELGKFDEAEASNRKAIVLKPDLAEAHRHLTLLKKFDTEDKQYLKMQELYLNKVISKEKLCHINFGLAKACEDLGNLEKAFQHYREGNVLRKKLLNYDISQDIELFKQLKSAYIRIKKNSLEIDNLTNKLMPIFIVGMPRSGTTLVEQIISSHSQVTGAGELSFISQFGKSIAIDSSLLDSNILLNFRIKYLRKLHNISKGNKFVIDKMPQNFRYIGLLVAAFPEAKIVHVKRKPAAVCWSNYKHYFSSKNLGYCYDLDDVIKYYELYKNLMHFWKKSLNKKIYNLDYELLTVNQENETRKLINYIGLNWEEKCLHPQDNTRAINTASDIQGRKKVYQGSSQQWKKYKPFLNGVFDYFDNLKTQ